MLKYAKYLCCGSMMIRRSLNLTILMSPSIIGYLENMLALHRRKHSLWRRTIASPTETNAVTMILIVIHFLDEDCSK